MRSVGLAVIGAAFLCVACDYTTATFRPYEARNSIVEGQGGARETVNGVDIWTTGDPPRRYQIIGTVELKGYEGYGSPNSVLADRTREAGGDAAIRMSRSSAYGGGVLAYGTFTAYQSTNEMYFVVRYLSETVGATPSPSPPSLNPAAAR